MTPEERREKAIDAFDGGPWAVLAYELLLTHFDETEPALADAIRFGLSPAEISPEDGAAWISLESWPSGSSMKTQDDITLYGINYPPGHPKA